MSFTGKVVVVGVAFLLVAGVAAKNADKVESECTVFEVSTPLVTQGLDHSAAFGKAMKALADGPPKFYEVAGAFAMGKLWVDEAIVSMGGEVDPSHPTAATGWRLASDEARAKQQAACCPAVAEQPDLDDGTEDGGGPAPFDPRTLSFRDSKNLTGKFLAADALAKAGFPKSEIPMFVAIAKAESGFNADPPGAPVVDGYRMHGMWQMNSRYWKDKDWRDPYVNAKMAKRARDESVKNRSDPYYPWSTRAAAKREASRYNDLVQSMPSQPQGPSGPGVEINPPTLKGSELPSFCAQVPGSGTGSTETPIKTVWPVAGKLIVGEGYAGHSGVDINRGSGNDDMGDRIGAVVSGTVIHAGPGKGYGNSIWIRTDTGGYYNIYGHASKVTVKKGQHVNAGEKIGEVGDTGNSSTAHLHFESRTSEKKAGTYKASLAFLEGKAKGFEVGGSDTKLVSQPAGKGNPYSPRARYVQKIVNAKYGCKVRSGSCVTSIGGYSYRNVAGTGTLSDHATGNADDIMLSNAGKTARDRALGKEIAEYLVANADVLNVSYVIFDIDGKGGPNIWSDARKREGWRNGGVGPHQNHVHVSFKTGTDA